MDFLQSNKKNFNKFDKVRNDNPLLVPLLSTPYEQALISEISTGTQLSNKPMPQQQQRQQINDEFSSNHMLPQQTSSLSSSLTPYAHMSCVYTGLQNYYRCNSM